MSTPRVSIVLVSDYAGGTEKSWTDLSRSLTALQAQHATAESPVEVILVEEDRFADAVPEDVLGLVPGMSVLSVSESASYAMKNAGVAAAKGDWVALLDADCVPAPGWLGALLSATGEQSEAAAISGRTTYGGVTLFQRLSALVQRSYLDPGRRGPAHFVSNNNAVWKREWFQRFPMPEDLGPFASRLQSERMLRAGAQLWFEPEMAVIHDFEGLAMDVDIAKNIGFGTVVTRLEDADMPHAGLVRLGPVAIPAIVLGKTWLRALDVVRCAAAYGVKAWQIPLAWSYAAVSTALEVPGMWAGYRGTSVGETEYR